MTTDATGRDGPPPLLSYATLALVILFWSGNFIVGRAVNGVIPPFTLAFVRWAGAALLVLPFAARHLWADRTVLIANWHRVLLLGLVGVAAFNAFVYSGLRYTSATNGLLLQAAVPPLVLLFDRTFFGQRTALLQLLGVLLSILGVMTVVLRGDLAAILALDLNFGDLLIMCGVICWSLYTSLLRLRPACHPLSFLTATFIIAALTMAPLAAHEMMGAHAIPISWPIAGAFAYVAVLPSLVAYFLYNAAVQNLGPAPAGQAITLMPVFGALLAALLLGERLHLHHLAGMILIFAGIAIGAWQAHRNRAEAPSRPRQERIAA